MTKSALTLVLFGAVLVPVLFSSPAEAQLSHTWVSSTGSNANPCTRAQPCASFSAALAVTQIGGTIFCADAGMFAGLEITKSVTIDCHDVLATMVSCSPTNTVFINIPAGNPSDPRRTVRLRNLTVTGGGDDGRGIGARCGNGGIIINSAAVVSIEDTLVTDFRGTGIRDIRTTDGRLTVTNTILRNNNGGLFVIPVSGSPRIDVAVDNVVTEYNNIGMAFTNGAKAMVSRSLIANNINTGIESDNVSGGTGAEVALDNSTVSNNGTGLFTFGGGVLVVSNSNVAFNAQGASGPWFSFGNNRIHRNVAAGTAPTAMGASTHDLGQQ